MGKKEQQREKKRFFFLSFVVFPFDPQLTVNVFANRMKPMSRARTSLGSALTLATKSSTTPPTSPSTAAAAAGTAEAAAGSARCAESLRRCTLGDLRDLPPDDDDVALGCSGSPSSEDTAQPLVRRQTHAKTTQPCSLFQFKCDYEWRRIFVRVDALVSGRV
jgi:hypothetical protein